MEERELKLYFVMFAIHAEKEWAAHAGYIFAKQEENIQLLLNSTYGQVYIRMVEEIPYKEGTVFYGSRWVSER